MLNKGNKAIVIIIFIFFACTERKDESKRENLFFQTSLNSVKNDLYYKNYDALNDSLNNWYNKLPSAEFMKNGAWQLDSLICFNKSSNRFVTCLMCKCQKYKTCNAEDLHFLYGAKISGKWYFFLGATLYLPRNMYQKDIHTPLTFAKLHEIALKEIYEGYLNK